MTEIENFVLPLHPTQRKPMSHFTMWDNHEERLSNLQEVHLPSDGVTPLTIDDESQQPDMPIKKVSKNHVFCNKFKICYMLLA